jgi:drug/metabolite transporter (DMT)-like permease
MNSTNDLAAARYKSAKSAFKKRGIAFAIGSGMCYGLYTAFLTLGMSKGVWADWYGANTAGLSMFVIVYVISAIGSAVNDSISGIWCLISAGIKGKLGDFARTLKTKPGLVMICCALIGGPIASTCYVVALQMGGAIIVPVASLNAAAGAIIGHFVFKQPLNKTMIGGIIICLLCATVIGGTSFSNVGPTALVACLIALICAVGWGIEGAVAGFGTTLIDYEVGITIRQCTSGLSNMIILVPLMCIMAGNIGLAPSLLGQAWNNPAIIFFIISGFFAMPAYSFWYKGNSMCGAALGMTCNGAYAFWAPFFCFIILGVINGQEGWALSPVQWIAALVMIVGIAMVGNLNPLSVFKKKEA